MSRRKRKKPRRSRSPKTATPNIALRGFDYGCLPYAMAVGAPDFPRHLTAASVVAVAYGWGYSQEIKRTVPLVSLVAEDAEEIVKAFDIFSAWSTSTDPDSLDVTFIFPSRGGYVLALAPEPSRLEQRCLGFDRTVYPLVFSVDWFKPIDSVSPFLVDLRKYCSAPVAPLLFGGAALSGPRSALGHSTPPAMRPIPGLRPLLKFDVAFVDEDAVKPETTAWVALHLGSHATSKQPKEPPRPDPRNIATRRVKALRCHFPVTLERLRRSSRVHEVVRRLRAEGICPWQVEQAICNLILKEEIERNAVGSSANERKQVSRFLHALRSHYELANGRDVPMMSEHLIREQVTADGIALLRYLQKKPANDLNSVQAMLSSASALDGTATAADFDAGKVPAK